MAEQKPTTCAVCEELLENPIDDICPTCADDIRVEEGSPYDDVIIDPETGKIYTAWGYNSDVTPPTLPPGWVP
jgi:RNA polymerase subunit RPABC4/transcription elongation factor Spt4